MSDTTGSAAGGGGGMFSGVGDWLTGLFTPNMNSPINQALGPQLAQQMQTQRIQSGLSGFASGMAPYLGYSRLPTSAMQAVAGGVGGMQQALRENGPAASLGLAGGMNALQMQRLQMMQAMQQFKNYQAMSPNNVFPGSGGPQATPPAIPGGQPQGTQGQGSSGWDLSKALSPEAQSTVTGLAQTGLMPQHVAAGIFWNESRGNTNAPDTTGATGQVASTGWQIQPDALAAVNKQFGAKYSMADLKSNPTLAATIAGRYWNMQQQTFKDPQLATMAYNWGPGNVQSWIQKGQNPAAVPPAVRTYVANVFGPGNMLGATPSSRALSYYTPPAGGATTPQAQVMPVGATSLPSAQAVTPTAQQLGSPPGPAPGGAPQPPMPQGGGQPPLSPGQMQEGQMTATAPAAAPGGGPPPLNSLPAFYQSLFRGNQGAYTAAWLQGPKAFNETVQHLTEEYGKQGMAPKYQDIPGQPQGVYAQRNEVTGQVAVAGSPTKAYGAPVDTGDGRIIVPGLNPQTESGVYGRKVFDPAYTIDQQVRGKSNESTLKIYDDSANQARLNMGPVQGALGVLATAEANGKPLSGSNAAEMMPVLQMVRNAVGADAFASMFGSDAVGKLTGQEALEKLSTQMVGAAAKSVGGSRGTNMDLKIMEPTVTRAINSPFANQFIGQTALQTIQAQQQAADFAHQYIEKQGGSVNGLQKAMDDAGIGHVYPIIKDGSNDEIRAQITKYPVGTLVNIGGQLGFIRADGQVATNWMK